MTPWEVIEWRINAAAAGDFVTANMFTVIIVGNSQSYISDGKIVTPRGYYRDEASGEEKIG